METWTLGEYTVVAGAILAFNVGATAWVVDRFNKLWGERLYILSLIILILSIFNAVLLWEKPVG